MEAEEPDGSGEAAGAGATGNGNAAMEAAAGQEAGMSEEEEEEEAEEEGEEDLEEEEEEEDEDDLPSFEFRFETAKLLIELDDKTHAATEVRARAVLLLLLHWCRTSLRVRDTYSFRDAPEAQPSSVLGYKGSTQHWSIRSCAQRGERCACQRGRAVGVHAAAQGASLLAEKGCQTSLTCMACLIRC